MSPQALLQALYHHDWMPAVLMLSVLVRTWLTDKSKFPVSLPVNWQPVVVAVATGFVNAVAGVQAGQSASVVVMTTLAWMGATGFLDGVLVAIFGDPKKAPVWARWVVMAFDDYEAPKNGGGGGTPYRTPAPVPAPAPADSTPTLVTKVPSMPPKPILTRFVAAGSGGWALAFSGGGLLCIGGMALGFLTACPAPAGLPAPQDVAQYYQDQNNCVERASTRLQADTCRLANHLEFCKKFPAIESCTTDSGLLEDAIAADVQGGDR